MLNVLSASKTDNVVEVEQISVTKDQISTVLRTVLEQSQKFKLKIESDGNVRLTDVSVFQDSVMRVGIVDDIVSRQISKIEAQLSTKNDVALQNGGWGGLLTVLLVVAVATAITRKKSEK